MKGGGLVGGVAVGELIGDGDTEELVGAPLALVSIRGYPGVVQDGHRFCDLSPPG